jgi:hypothetical protein
MGRLFSMRLRHVSEPSVVIASPIHESPIWATAP